MYGNYTLTAAADMVSGDTNTTNNNFTDGWVIVSIKGDLTGGTLTPGTSCQTEKSMSMTYQCGQVFWAEGSACTRQL